MLDRLERFWLWVLFPLLIAMAFGVYLRYAQKYVGACDWYGYYEQAQLIKHGKVSLDTEVSPKDFPAIVPFGFHSVDGRIVPQYPPGYPLILALFGMLGFEYYTNPVLGLLSCLLLYLLLKEKSPPWIAALFTVAWAFNPIVVYGATSVMSDLPAAVCVMGAWLAYRRAWLWTSALAFGFGLVVRPSNALFGLAFLPILWSDRRLLAYALRLCVPVIAYGIYNGLVYGAPWRTGYADISSDLAPAVFGAHALYYVDMTCRQLGPLVPVFALLAWGKRSRDLIFWVLGFLLLFVFYSLWRSGGDVWWWTRFLLPAYPGLYLLAALGFSWLLEKIQSSFGQFPAADRRSAGLAILGFALSAVFVMVAALLPLRAIDYGIKRQDLWIENKGLDYRLVSEQCAALVPTGSFVGSVEFAGSMRLYAPAVVPFVTVRAGSFDLVQHVIRQGRPVAILIEPWNREHESVKRMLATYRHELVKEFPLWGGLRLYQLSP